MFSSLQELQDRGKVTPLNLLAVLLLRQPGANFALLAARAHSWLMSSLLSTRTLLVLILLDQQPFMHTAVLLYKLFRISILTHSSIWALKWEASALQKKKRWREKRKGNTLRQLVNSVSNSTTWNSDRPVTLWVELRLSICYVNSCPWTNCPGFLLVLERGTDTWDDAYHFSRIARELQKDVGAS